MITMDIMSVKMALIYEINRWAIASHSTHYDFGYSLAGKYNYIISEYLEEFPTENVGKLVVGA